MTSELYTSYRTIKNPSEGTYSEKRSKFLAFAFPVESESEALERVEAIRKKYYDARHVCWAYRIGKEEKQERVNDDGEPSSTAGKPILGQILSRDITDIIIIVVRYFGGVKLGTGGLIVAYRTAAEEVIAGALVEEKILYTEYELSFPFDLINPVMMLLKSFDVNIKGTDATPDGHRWHIQVSNSDVLDFSEKIKLLYQVQVVLLTS